MKKWQNVHLLNESKENLDSDIKVSDCIALDVPSGD
jgi:hypothetical protein